MSGRPDGDPRAAPACRCDRADGCWYDNISGGGPMPCACGKCRRAFHIEILAGVAIAAVSAAVIATIAG